MKKVIHINPLYLLFVSIFFITCQQKKDKIAKNTSGKINTISVIIDDQLWNGEVGDSIRNKFASPVVGLPQEEPLFTINQYPVKLLEGFITNTRNSIVIKKGRENSYKYLENEYATPQNVFHITGKTTTSILEQIEENAPEIIKKIRQTEIEANQRIMDTSMINIKKIVRKFHIKLHVPKGYKYVYERRKFIWLKKEISSGNNSLLIYQVPFSVLKKGTNPLKCIIRTRDSIGNLYIHGTIPNTKMITEDSYSPYLFPTKIKGKKAFETKGTWELKNDFMSGPFINYSIIDQTNKRILVLEGFCYDPSKEKRDSMFELEAIIKSIEFIKNKGK